MIDLSKKIPCTRKELQTFNETCELIVIPGARRRRGLQNERENGEDRKETTVFLA